MPEENPNCCSCCCCGCLAALIIGTSIIGTIDIAKHLLGKPSHEERYKPTVQSQNHVYNPSINYQNIVRE